MLLWRAPSMSSASPKPRASMQRIGEEEYGDAVAGVVLDQRIGGEPQGVVGALRAIRLLRIIGRTPQLRDPPTGVGSSQFRCPRRRRRDIREHRGDKGVLLGDAKCQVVPLLKADS
jgi:hypothetical protein